jgi:nucleoside-diphosphate-sugar epimerase
VSTLVCLGFGYSAQHHVANYGRGYTRIVGTTRRADNAAALAARRFGGSAVEMIVFDGKTVPPSLADVVRAATTLVVSIAPDEGGADPALTRLGDALAAAKRLAAVVYLSTIAVYGNHDGAWIDETTPLAPVLTRACDRVAAEQAWQAFGARHGIAVAVIRIAGIYGPGTSALEAVRAGRARRIVKPGQVFNRIHVDDLAQIIEMAAARRADGVFNAADDEPTPPGDPITFAADLLGVAPPPEVPFEEASKTMTPFAASFYGESKRVHNHRIKSVLGVSLRYPTYREGLRALASAAGAT